MDDDHHSLLFSNLNKDRKGRRKYCGIQVATGDVVFYAHRCVLGTYSLYFDTLVGCEFSERFSKTVKLTGPLGENISSRTVEVILDFCYTNKAV